VATPIAVVVFEYTTTRVSSDHNSHTRFVIFVLGFGTVPFLWVVVGWSFFSLLHPLSCSVFRRKEVQSGRVQLEYGGGDKDG
jgi:hypothetical protein